MGLYEQTLKRFPKERTPTVYPAGSLDAYQISTTLTLKAGEVINGGIATILETDGKVYKFDILNNSHQGKFCGISKHAAIYNEDVVIVTSGECEEVGSGWTAGVPYFIGSSSVLTPTPPTVGIVHKVGVGISTDKILINNTLELEAI